MYDNGPVIKEVAGNLPSRSNAHARWMKIGADLAELIQCSLSDCDAPRSDRPMFAVPFKAFEIEQHGQKGFGESTVRGTGEDSISVSRGLIYKADNLSVWQAEEAMRSYFLMATLEASLELF